MPWTVDFRLVSAGAMAPLERRLEGRLRQTMSVLLGSEVSEMAWERAKLPTCYGGLSIRVAQMGFAAQATYWSTADLHKACYAEHLRSVEQADT